MADLTARHVQILLVMSDGPGHGYAISKVIEERTGGEIVLRPGSMYRALHQLLEMRCIEEAPGTAADPRRREYRVTASGRDALADALSGFREMVEEGTRLGLVGEEASP